MERERDATAEPIREALPLAASPAVSTALSGPSGLGSLATGSLAARAATIGRLQRSAGNAAVQRMLAASPHVCGPGCGHQRAILRSAHICGPGCEHQAMPAAAFDGGNYAPGGREIASGEHVERRAFSVSIAAGPNTRTAAPPVPAAASRDQAEGSPQPSTEAEVPEPAATAAGAAAPAAAPAGAEGSGEMAAAAAEPAAAGPAEPAAGAAPAAAEGAAPGEGEVITIPDIIKPELEHIHACDSIAGIIPYNGTVVGGETPPGTAFGICRFGDVRVTGITITLTSGVYQVRGSIENRIKWGVQSLGRTNIIGNTDTDITAANYNTVSSDLTPNMSSSGGRPPRTQFYSQDLTERHERYHADDVRRQGPGAATSAVSWISSQTATDVAGVQALVNQIPNRVVRTLVAGMGEPAEVRAYGDGAPSYRTRANSIKIRGDAGSYT